jgi:hypothetical protein
MKTHMEQKIEAVERIHQQIVVNHHPLECDCKECQAAWDALAKLQDNEPAELHALLGGEN